MANPAPAVVAMTLNPAEAWSVDYRIKNGGDSSNANLNGASVELQAWNPARTTQYASADVSWLDRSAGLVRVVVPQVLVAAMPRETTLRADLALVDSLSNRRLLVRYVLSVAVDVVPPGGLPVYDGGPPSPAVADLILGGSPTGEINTIVDGGGP